MGQPAARTLDQSAHGGIIMGPGCPTVMIGGMPAVRVSDMHVCPMLNPGVPPPPHVGANIAKGSATVFIGGMPAARATDILVCTGPPDIIAMGCPTVMIGDAGPAGGGGGGGGGGGSGGGGGGSSTGAVISAIIAASSPPASPPGGPPSREGHWIKYEFVDKTGNPISGAPYKFTSPDNNESEGLLGARGTVWWSGENAGQGTVNLMDIHNARWSTQEARVGDTVTLSADVDGYPSSTDATFTIFKRDVSGADRLVTTLETQTQGNRVEIQWVYDPNEDTGADEIESEEKRGYSSVKFYFIIRVRGQHARSDMLEYIDWVEIELKNQNGDPMSNEEYIVYLGDGGVRRGNLEQNGRKKEEGIPPGKCYVVFPRTQGVVPVSA